MKKFTFCLCAFLAAFAMNAQDSCDGAVAVTEGTTTVGTIDGTLTDPSCMDAWLATASEWYNYTATEDVVVTISTDLPDNQDVDTRVTVYEGPCDALTCYATNDDVDSENFLSEVQFVAYAGNTYTFAFDDNWDASGFDFELSTSTEIPDAAPEAVINPTPADGAVNVDYDEDNAITLSWDPATSGGDANNYDIYLGFDADDLYLIAGTAGTSYVLQDLPTDSEVFWRVVPVNALGAAQNPDTWSFTTGSGMSVEGPDANEVSYFYNQNTQHLEVSVEESLEKLTVYSLQGQEIFTMDLNGNAASVDVSTLKTGIYLARLSINGKSSTIKFVKR